MNTQQIVVKLNKIGADEIRHYVEEMDPSLSENCRAILENALNVYLACPDDISNMTAARNIASLARVPASHLTDIARLSLMRRAISQDVYAYSSGSTWYLWDTDTRIVLPLLSKLRYLVKIQEIAEDFHSASVTVIDCLQKRVQNLTYLFSYTPSVSPSTSYVRRRIDALIGVCNANDQNPAEYDGAYIA